MKVVLVRQGPAKLVSWFEENKGKIFDVIRKQEWGYQEWGYDVDLGPCGHPGITGYVSNDEVVEVYETSNNSFQDLIEHVCEGQRDAFFAFVERGEDRNNFVAHVVGCKKCEIAVEKMFEKTIEAFERLAGELCKKR